MWTVWLWMTGLRHVPASRAGVFTVMLPITAAAVGLLFLGEQMNGVQFVGIRIGAGGLAVGDLAGAPGRGGVMHVS